MKKRTLLTLCASIIAAAAPLTYSVQAMELMPDAARQVETINTRSFIETKNTLDALRTVFAQNEADTEQAAEGSQANLQQAEEVRLTNVGEQGLNIMQTYTAFDQDMENAVLHMISLLNLSDAKLSGTAVYEIEKDGQILTSPVYYILETSSGRIPFTMEIGEDSWNAKTWSETADVNALSNGTLQLKENITVWGDRIDDVQAYLASKSEVSVQSETSEEIAVQSEETSQAVSEAAVPADASAQEFVDEYCTYNGSVITSVTSQNYQTILDGYASWEVFTSTKRSAVNKILEEAGSESYQNLYTYANQIRLGLPSSAEDGTSVSKKSGVNTAAVTLGAVYVLGAAAAAGTTWYVRKKKPQTRS
jgi:hypothetical protein